jgi:probable phosphoglycerate mutase
MLRIPAKQFYLARHGESVANLFNRVAGREWDADLTAKGMEQACALADLVALLDKKPSVIFHSPLIRAMKTAGIVARAHEIPLTAIDDLAEQGLGDWNGRTWAELAEKFMNAEDPPGGETKQDYAARIVSALREGLDAAGEGTPLFVSHGGTFYGLAMLTECFNGMQEIKNCHLYRYAPVVHEGRQTWEIMSFSHEGKKIICEPAPFSPAHR